MIHFQLVTMTGVIIDEDVYEVILPTIDGTIAVLGNHMPLVGAGDVGIISVRKKLGDSDDQLEHFSTMGGIIEVDGHNARFVADDVSTPDEISEAEATQAYERAQHLLSNAKSQVDLETAKHQLQRSNIRLQVAKLKKRHHR